MLYAIIADDRPDSLSARLAARPAHLARKPGRRHGAGADGFRHPHLHGKGAAL